MKKSGTALVWTAVFLGACGCHSAPYTIDRVSSASEYWNNPSITNGNGRTHICAHIMQTHAGKWVAELPGPGQTPTAVTPIKNTRDEVADYTDKNCRGELPLSHLPLGTFDE